MAGLLVCAHIQLAIAGNLVIISVAMTIGMDGGGGAPSVLKHGRNAVLPTSLGLVAQQVGQRPFVSYRSQGQDR